MTRQFSTLLRKKRYVLSVKTKNEDILKIAAARRKGDKVGNKLPERDR